MSTARAGGRSAIPSNSFVVLDRQMSRSRQIGAAARQTRFFGDALPQLLPSRRLRVIDVSTSRVQRFSGALRWNRRIASCGKRSLKPLNSSAASSSSLAARLKAWR